MGRGVPGQRMCGAGRLLPGERGDEHPRDMETLPRSCWDPSHCLHPSASSAQFPEQMGFHPSAESLSVQQGQGLRYGAHKVTKFATFNIKKPHRGNNNVAIQWEQAQTEGYKRI